MRTHVSEMTKLEFLYFLFFILMEILLIDIIINNSVDKKCEFFRTISI